MRKGETTTADSAAQRRTQQVDGIPMSWVDRGTGVPVVLVHGIPTGPDLWRHVLPRVRGARLHAWEMVGYAGSIAQGRDRDISVAKQAEYLATWLDAMSLQRVILAGHDLGGGVAHIFAVRHPERAAGLLLTNAIGYDSWPIPSVRLLCAFGGIVSRLPNGIVRAGIFRMLMARGHANSAMADESLDLHWRKYASGSAGAALIRQIRALDTNDTVAVAPEIPRLRGTPARVIWGAADQFQKVEYGQRFASDLGVTLERIEGGKHFTPEDHPERIAAALQSLIDEVAARGA